MPHKRNPITAERLTGLARVLRGYVIPGLEDVALWHERDISHSSVERIILPDAIQLTYYLLVRAERLVDTLVVSKEKMAENLLVGSLGLVFSQPVLLALIGAGLSRDDAYRIVQRDATRARATRSLLREVLDADDEVTTLLAPADLDRAFDLSHALFHTDRVIDAVRGLAS